MQVYIPAGFGIARAIQVVQHKTADSTRKKDQLSEAFALRYATPIVSSVAYSSSGGKADTKGDEVTITGLHFGSAGANNGQVKPFVLLYRPKDELPSTADTASDENDGANEDGSGGTFSLPSSWKPKINILNAAWQDDSCTFTLPPGLGSGIKLTVTVGEQTSIVVNTPAVLIDYHKPTISQVLPASIPSSGKIHKVCDSDVDCVPPNQIYNDDIHICDFGFCKVGDPVQMTISGNFFGTEDLSADAAITVAIDGNSITVDTTWELRVEFINLGQVTTTVAVADMTVVQDNKLQFTAPPSLGQAESTGYRVVVGSQVSKVYRSFACAADDTTCRTNLDAFEKIESDLLIDGTGETTNLIKALDGLSGIGLSVIDSPSLLQVHPKNGPTDGCKEYEPIEIWRERVGSATASESDPAAAIAKSSDLARKCQIRETITLSGLSLGNGKYPSNNLEIWLTNVTQIGSGFKVYDANVARHNTACLSVPVSRLGDISPATSGATGGCAHVDNKLIFPAPISPPNYGRNLYFYVVVGGTPSKDRVVESKVVSNAFLSWEFAPPSLTEITFRPYDARGASTPGSVSVDGNLCSIGGTYVNPSPPGCELQMQGLNFGGSKSDVGISIGSKKCLNPEWRAAHPENGLPYLRCRPQEDVVGAKNATISVAAQSQIFPSSTTNVKSSWFRSACRNGRSAAAQLEGDGDSSGADQEVILNYFGRDGELCVKCPVGAICTTPVASGSQFTYADPIAEKNFFRTTLNLTSKAEEASRRCGAKRVNTTALLVEYPGFIDKGFCFNFVGCRPKESCLGNNKCQRGYEHVKHQCGKWQKQNPTKNTCTSDRDCRTRSGRSWDGDIEENCGLSNAEDCAVCDMTGATGLSLAEKQRRVGTGTCSCSQPRRCSLCTRPALEYFYPSDPTVEVEGFFRLDGVCEECPKDPIILFVFFFVAIFFLLIGGFILSQKEFNVAFISIGVDYFQVLSILRSARVEWPPFLKALVRCTVILIYSCSFISFNTLTIDSHFPSSLFRHTVYNTHVLTVTDLLNIQFGY